MTREPRTLSLAEMEEQAQAAALEAHRAEFDLVGELLLLVNQGTAAMSGVPHDRGVNFLVGILCVRAFNTLIGARDQLVRGYPVQAMTLARAALEDWVAAEWVTAVPERAALFLSAFFSEVEHPVDAKGRPAWVPSFDNQLTELPSELQAEPRLVYRELSDFGHPRGLSLRQQITVDYSSGEMTVSAGGRYERGITVAGLFHLVRIASGLLPTVEKLQTRWRGEADRDWQVRSIAAVSRAHEYLRRVIDEIEKSELEGKIDDSDVGLPANESSSR